MEYKTKQTGWVIIGLCCAVIIGLSIFLVSLSEVDPSAMPALYFMTAFFSLLILLFGRLETTVNNDSITVKFGLGLIKKTIALSDIKTIKQVRNTFWYGWGIRLTPHGWLWNIAGYEAVEIEFKAERKNFRIGCKSSEELEKAIKERL